MPIKILNNLQKSGDISARIFTFLQKISITYGEKGIVTHFYFFLKNFGEHDLSPFH